MSAARRTATSRRRAAETEKEEELALVHESGKTIELAEELGYAYREYARYTLLDRAIADVRDGFKPVHRRIVYAMGDMGLGPTAQHRKSARVVGEVLGKYHPHGDQSVYDALARMAQDFSLRDVLIDGQGNFGSVDGDAPAAMRYTEVRLSALGGEMLRDIEMETVDWQDNFDNSLLEPVVLPATFPNILVNGSSGIAVGFAANLPPHNLGEVCDAVRLMCRRWAQRDRVTVDDLFAVIPGPDFPTGGIVYRYRLDRVGSEDIRSDAIRAAYETGSAGIVCQARMSVEPSNGSRSGPQIVVTEIPYGQQKSTIIQRIANEARSGKISGVMDIVDESDRDGMRVVVQLSRQADPEDVLEMLVRRTTLRSTFGVNNLVLAPKDTGEGRIVAPETLSLRAILEHFVLHRLDVIRRRSQYELDRRRARLHVVEGLLIALDHIDEVIDTIRRSRTVDTARRNLMRKFKLSEIQATAILDMQLRRLAAMERTKLKEEEEELKARIDYLEALLASEAKQLTVIDQETSEIRTQYATPRRTTIVDAAPGEKGAAVTSADLAVPDHPQMVVLTTAGVARTNLSDYSYRVRGGASSRAVTAHRLRFPAEPTERVYLLSTRGQMWLAPVGQVPEQASPTDLGLGADDTIVFGGGAGAKGDLVLGTQLGRIKRTELAALVETMPEREWIEIIGLEEGDRLLFAGMCGEKGQILFFTENKVLRIEASDVNSQQTPSARGVIGIKIADEDRLVGGQVVEPSDELMVFVLSAKGYMRRVPLKEFSTQGRATMGVQSLKVTKATGPVATCAAGVCTDSTTVDVLARDGKRQRLEPEKVPVMSRSQRGRKVVSLADPIEIVLLQ